MLRLNLLYPASKSRPAIRLRTVLCCTLFVLQLLLLTTSIAFGQVKSVASVGMTVSDMDRAVEFYSKVLHFTKISDQEVAGTEYEHLEGLFGLRMRVVKMKLGDEFIELTDYLAPEGRPIPVDSRSNDQWFQHFAIIVRNMDKAYAWLRENKVQHSSPGPQRLPDWNKNAGGIKAFYFKDPDNHSLEILEFPEGKGDSKWHQASDQLFLGIDHTAIVVRDTQRSLDFYRDALGFRVGGESENYGIEQERLNNVFGAHLRITGMRAPAGGPGIEFLEYLTPRDGRSTPEDVHSNDLIHWQTTLLVPDSGAIASTLMTKKCIFISSGLVEIPGAELGFRKGILVRDPDGHAMRLVQQ